jgi:pimeloyl-ACP methyl ester carboxylesterase
VSHLPPANDAAVETPGPWWTELEPSLRVPRTAGHPAAIWSTGEGSSLLLVPPEGRSHDVWATVSEPLGASCTVHALDRTATTSFADDVDLVATAARAVGACFLAGYTDDAAVLREAASQTPVVRRALVLSSLGDARTEERMDPPLIVRVAVSAPNPAALTRVDAARMIETLRREPAE